MSKGIDRKLDDKWSLIVKKRAGNKCEKCGETSFLNSHHVFGRKNKSTRWEITNGCCLCVSCHKFNSKFSAHETPTIFTEWIIGQRGEEWHEELTVNANLIKKWTKEEKQELLNNFNKMLIAE